MRPRVFVLLLSGWSGRWGALSRWRGRWGARFGGRGEDEAFADQGKAYLGKFSLEELVFGAGKEVGIVAGDGGDEVMDRDGLAVQSSLLVGVGGEPDGNDGACLLGNDGPEVAIVIGYGQGQKGFQGAGVEVGEEDGGGVVVPGGWW